MITRVEQEELARLIWTASDNTSVQKLRALLNKDNSAIDHLPIAIRESIENAVYEFDKLQFAVNGPSAWGWGF